MCFSRYIPGLSLEPADYRTITLSRQNLIPFICNSQLPQLLGCFSMFARSCPHSLARCCPRHKKSAKFLPDATGFVVLLRYSYASHEKIWLGILSLNHFARLRAYPISAEEAYGIEAATHCGVRFLLESSLLKQQLVKVDLVNAQRSACYLHE